MIICLLTLAYPPASTEGIARQRQTLAAGLTRLGHEVHVITLGPARRTRDDAGATVHEVAAPRALRYSPDHPALDEPLTRSQALFEGLADLARRRPVDIVDVPLWAAQGFVTHQRYAGVTALWLQTTTAQLLAINGQRPAQASRWMLDLERICLQRAHGLLSDSQAALESVRRDYQAGAELPAQVVYLGMPPLPAAPATRPPRDTIEALVVGRLERRKGTPLLLSALPELLRRHPQLRVRFAGSDNSANDGWRDQHGQSYPDHFRARHPELDQRVVFEGYVDDERLARLYLDADMLLAPSVYESFGLIYLEAMRAGLPVATFHTGGAAEIFARGEADGALLASPGSAAELASAISRLVGDPELRARLGRAGRARFDAAFTAETMARETLAFYEQLIARSAPRRRARPVYQVMEALSAGDAVSDIARTNARHLAEAGYSPLILTRQTGASPGAETADLARALETPECALIVHYWGYSAATWMRRSLRGRMALYYHNITPPSFFPPDSPTFRHLARGYQQLAQIAGEYDLLIGDSRYNLDCLAPLLRAPKPALCIYPTVERDALLRAPYDERLAARLRASGGGNILFVGRLAPNKRQDLVMRAFDRYASADPRARLWLVGSDSFDRSYSEALQRLRRELPSGGRITLTGKVAEHELIAYYRAAGVLVCASEHEGFCVPLAQAMAFDVPVVASGTTAIPETLGDSPGLIAEWSEERAAALIEEALRDGPQRERMLAAQRESLARFSAAHARERLAAAARFLLTGEQSPLIETVGPAAGAP